jgi:hypothetical protein
MINIEHLSDADLDLIAERYKLIQAEINEVPQDEDAKKLKVSSES